jgi:methyl-accepting chemotaxis protein
MNKKAANIQTLTKIAELEDQVKTIGAMQGITINDIRETIHQIAEQIALIADAIPAIAARLEELARWIAAATEPGEASPVNPFTTELAKPAKAAKK